MHFKGISEEIDTDVQVGLFLDQNTASTLRPMLESSGINIAFTAETRGSDNFLQKLAPSELSHLKAVIIDLTHHKDPVAIVRELHQRCPGNIKIIAIGSKDSVGFYRKICSAGANEYYVHPVPIDELAQNLRKLLCLDGGNTKSYGRMVVVYGSQGGTGTGTISAGLSVILSQKHGRRTILVDTDFACPTAGSNIGCDQPGNLSMLLEEVDRLDNVLISQVVQTPIANLSLLDSYEGLGVKREISPDAADVLSNLLGDDYRYQVWRVNGSHSSLSTPALARADVVVMVMNGTLQAARSAQSTLRWLAENNSSARIIHVYNRPAPESAIPAQAMEGVIGHKIKYTIPYQRSLSSSMLQGIQANSPKYCLNKYLEQISADILGISSVEKSLFKKVMK